MSGRPVQVFSAEHYVRSHHAWTCAGSPIKDPRSGETLGVVDVSGPAATIHPTTLALVDAVARLAESQLREQHHRSLDTLRAVAAPILARSPGPALAVDPARLVAALDTVSPRSRLVLPQVDSPGGTGSTPRRMRHRGTSGRLVGPGHRICRHRDHDPGTGAGPERWVDRHRRRRQRKVDVPSVAPARTDRRASHRTLRGRARHSCRRTCSACPTAPSLCAPKCRACVSISAD